MGDFVRVERRDRIAILTLDSPARLNAIGSIEDCDDLVAAIEDVEADDTISVAIQTGAGRAFSAGGNIQAMRSEEHTSELQSLMRVSYAVFCLKKKRPVHHN